VKFTFHPDARFELEQAVEFYESQQTKVGLEFLEELYSTIHRILDFPKAFPILSKNTRRCLTNRFPFAVIYQVKPKEIFIVAITHLARKPGYWKERTKHP